MKKRIEKIKWRFSKWQFKGKIQLYLNECEALTWFYDFECSETFRGFDKAAMNKKIHERRRRKNHELYGEIISTIGQNKLLLSDDYVSDFYESNNL